MSTKEEKRNVWKFQSLKDRKVIGNLCKQNSNRGENYAIERTGTQKTAAQNGGSFETTERGAVINGTKKAIPKRDKK